MPADWKASTASGVEGMLAPSATTAQPPRSRVAALSPSSSFWVAQGRATSPGRPTRRPVGHEAGAGAALDVVGHAAALDLLDLLEQLEVHTGLVDDVAGGVGEGDGDGAELLGLLDGVDRHVAGTGDDDLLALEGLALVESMDWAKSTAP